MALLALVALVLLQEPFLSIFNLFLNFTLNDVHVLALSDLDADFFLELQHRFTDNLVIEVNHVLLDLAVEFWELVHNRLQIGLAEPVAFYKVESFEIKLRLVSEEVLIASNYGLSLELDVEILLLAFLEADGIAT